MAKKASKSSLRSFADFPLTGKEIRELEAIQDKAYWARKPLKEAFCLRNNRMITDVNEYFLKHQRPPVGTGKRGKKENPGVDPIESTPAPKEQVTKLPKPSFSRTISAGEIRVTFKRMIVEGNQIIFEI